MKNPSILARVIQMVLVCVVLVVSAPGCALKQNPGESPEDFENRRQEARETAARNLEGIGETAAQVLPPPFGAIVAAALVAAGGWYAGQRRRPTPPTAPSAQATNAG